MTLPTPTLTETRAPRLSVLLVGTRAHAFWRHRPTRPHCEWIRIADLAPLAGPDASALAAGVFDGWVALPAATVPDPSSDARACEPRAAWQRALSAALQLARGDVVAVCDAALADDRSLGPWLDSLLHTAGGDAEGSAAVSTLDGRAGVPGALGGARRWFESIDFGRGPSQLPVPAKVPAKVPASLDPAALAARLAAQGVALQAWAPGPPQARDLEGRDIPVFIVQRNRPAPLRRLVDWLRAAGTARVVVLDNASSDPSLLRYYADLPAGVSVVRLPHDGGPQVLWQQGLHRQLDTPFIVADASAVPAQGCPPDLAERLLDVLRRYPDVQQVSPAARLDDLPPDGAAAQAMHERERERELQHWRHPVAPGLFAAPSHPGFTLYAAGAVPMMVGLPATAPASAPASAPPSLRLGRPYLLDGLSSGAPPDTAGALPTQSMLAEEVDPPFGAVPRWLNLDAQGEAIPGWLNAGPAGSGAEIAFDWGAGTAAALRLPLPDDALDGLRLNHVLEQVRESHALWAELHRVARPGARLQVRVAHGAAPGYWDAGGNAGRDARGDAGTGAGTGADRVRAWYENSFAFLAQPSLADSRHIAYAGDWQLEALRCVVADLPPGASGGVASAAGDATPLLMLATLVAVKPARARAGRDRREGPDRRSREGPPRALPVRPVFTVDDRADPVFPMP